MANKISDLGLALIAVAALTTLVAHRGSAKVITAIGNAFSQSIKAATGR